jgi:hypothetical protein
MCAESTPIRAFGYIRRITYMGMPFDPHQSSRAFRQATTLTSTRKPMIGIICNNQSRGLMRNKRKYARGENLVHG